MEPSRIRQTAVQDVQVDAPARARRNAIVRAARCARPMRSAQLRLRAVGEEGMSKLVVLNAGPRAPSDLSANLRALADAVDAGSVADVIYAYDDGDALHTGIGTSLRNGLWLATNLHQAIVERMRR